MATGILLRWRRWSRTDVALVAEMKCCCAIVGKFGFQEILVTPMTFSNLRKCYHGLVAVKLWVIGFTIFLRIPAKRILSRNLA